MTDTGPALPRLRPIEAVAGKQDGLPVYHLRDPYHYSDAVVTLSPYAALIVQLLDGKNTHADIGAVLSRGSGEPYPAEKIDDVIRALDECYFLDNERFAARKNAVERNFADAPVRPSPLAGRSYPADRSELCALLDGLFAAPDMSAASRNDGRDGIIGIISPHIDYARGGASYVPAYRAIASSDADTFVIFGISHTGGDTPLILSRKDYETPLGRIPTDIEIIDLIESELAGQPGWDRPYASQFAHANEHSIEFQAVFLQYIRPKRPFKIVPILCAFSHAEVQAELDNGGDGPIGSFLQALRRAAGRITRRVAFIAGVDFAHVGAQFGDSFPIREKELAFHRERDGQMMAMMAAGGPADFHRVIADESNSRRVCGYSAIYSLLCVLPEAALASGRILKYGQWPDPSGTVTFGSLSFSERS